MTEYIDRGLAPLVAQLRARYNGVRIVSAYLRRTHGGVLQQSIRYQAPIETLRIWGLLTGSMISGRHGRTPIGDGFHLCDGLDAESRPGHWDLTIFTAACSWERERFSVRAAHGLIQRIARASRDVAGARGIK